MARYTGFLSPYNFKQKKLNGSRVYLSDRYVAELKKTSVEYT